MALLSVAEIRALIPSSLTDEALQAVIDREDAAIVAAYGAHYSAGQTITEAFDSQGFKNLYMARPVASVTTITEATVGYTAETLAAADYYLWGRQGRIERLPRSRAWGDVVTVTYAPADDNALRESILVDLVRLALERKALQSESIAGEYSYTTGANWDRERGAILRRLGMGV